MYPIFQQKKNSGFFKMSGNGVSPIPDDKILAYIYDDVDDSDIFALESPDTNFTKTDIKNEDKESTDIQTSECLKENEDLKAVVKQLQLEKDMLELRISEIYRTAKAEIERKDRRIQLLNEEKNNILFRRNKNFINRQPQHNVTNIPKAHEVKELTNEEFHKFSVTYKIPKKENLDDKDTGNDKKISESFPRPVLEDEVELKTLPRNERQHNPRKPLYNKDSYGQVGESSNMPSKEKCYHNIPPGKPPIYGNRSRSRNRSEYQYRPPHLSGSSPVKNEYKDYKNSHKIMDDEERREVTEIIVEESSDIGERAELKNEIKYQQRRESTSEPEVHDLNKDRPKVKNVTCPRTPSQSPPRQNSSYRRSRSLRRGRIDEKTIYRCKSEHKGPITPPGSPPRDLQDTSRQTSVEKNNYRSRMKRGTHSRSPHDKDYSTRPKSSFKLEEQNEVQSREDSKKISNENQLVDVIKTEDIYYAPVIYKGKENVSQEVEKTRTLDVKSNEESKCRSKSKEKQTNSQEVKVRSLDTGKYEERRYRSKSKERDKISVNNSKTHEKSLENDRKPISSRSYSRRSRSRSREKDNRRHNFRNRSRSNDRYSRRSPENDRYRKNFKEVRPRLGSSYNRNNLSSSDRNPIRRDRYLGYRDWKNRNQDYPQRRDYRKNHMLPNFNRLREKVLRYSLERAPEALNDVTKTIKDRKNLPKENDTDHSDLEDLKLHLSGASDDISSTEDAKEGKYHQMDVENHFELVKHLGPNILQMGDDELERLLQGRMKELEASYKDLEEENEPVFSDYEEDQLTEIENSEDVVEVSINVDRQECNRHIEHLEFSLKDKEESTHRNQKAGNDRIQDRIMYSENVNNTCQQTYKTLFEKRQCINRKVKENQKVNDEIVRCGSNRERSRGCEKLEPENKMVSDAQPNVQNNFEAMQHTQTMDKQNGNENNGIKKHNTYHKMQEENVQKLEDSKLDSDRNAHTLYEETDNSTSRKKSYSNIMETIEEAKTKHIDFMLTKREEKAIKKQYTVENQDPQAHIAESKVGPSEKMSQYRDPRENSNSKDLREKSAKEKDAYDAHSMQKKIKINLDVYKKRKKSENADTVEVLHSEATTEPPPMNDKCIISDINKTNEVSADMLHTPTKILNKCDKDVDIIPRDEIDNDTSLHPDIRKVAEGNRYPNKQMNNTYSETVHNEVKSIPEDVTDHKNQIVLEYSPVVTDQDDENVISGQQYSKESTSVVKDTNSFLHDFSLSEDEDDIQTRHSLLEHNTSSDLDKNEKIKILDVTIVKPSFSVAPERDLKKNIIAPESKIDQVVGDSSASDGLTNSLQSSECIEQIQEAVHMSNVNMKQSNHTIDYQHDSVQKLNTEELKKCLEDDRSGAKDELKAQDESLPKQNSDQEIAKDTVKMSDGSGASQGIKIKNQKQELMLLLFGESPSPSRLPSSTSSDRSNANAEQLKKATRNLMVESTQNIKIHNKKNVHQKKTVRSKSLDERLLKKPFIEEDDFEEKQIEDQSKSLNNRRVTDLVQYPLFCNNPTYIPNPQNPVAFDSPNRYIRKKMDEYKGITGAEIKDKTNIIQYLCNEKNRGENKPEKMDKVIAQEATGKIKGLAKKPNEIIEPEKKKRSTNGRFKVKFFSNQSIKRKGTGASQECRQTKKKKIHHALLDSGEEVQSPSSDSETNSVEKNPDDEIREQNKRMRTNKSTKVPKRKSKNDAKRKESVDAENISRKMNTSTESAPISSSQSELNISNEIKCEREESKTELKKRGRKKNLSKERGEEHQETASIEQHCKENITETGVVLRRGGRIRKQPGFYQSMSTGVHSNDESCDRATCKGNKRRITPIKVGESSNKVCTNSNTAAQSINTSEGSYKTFIESDESAVNSQNTKLVGTSKRKLCLIDEQAQPEKFPRLCDKGSSEESDPVPLPNIQETLKQCEMKMCETISDSRIEEVPAISTDVAGIDCGKQNRSFNDSSLPEINLDTKDADLLGSFERGLFENMNDYLCDKSILSLASEGRPKSDKDSNSATNEIPKIQTTKEGVNQVSFCNFLIDNTNTSTPIKVPNVAKENKANIISSVQIASSQSVTSNNNSYDKTSQGKSSSSSSTVVPTKSYLASPLKRDRRRRIGIVMVDVT